ncbi:uncharacterized protein METZ01_LOCUS198214, partial [marine metagenome]
DRRPGVDGGPHGGGRPVRRDGPVRRSGPLGRGPGSGGLGGHRCPLRAGPERLRGRSDPAVARRGHADRTPTDHGCCPCRLGVPGRHRPHRQTPAGTGWRGRRVLAAHHSGGTGWDGRSVTRTGQQGHRLVHPIGVDRTDRPHLPNHQPRTTHHPFAI